MQDSNKNNYKEIEYKYFNIDVESLRQRLRKVNATMVRPKIVMRLITFTHPTNNQDSYIRVRDETTRITMTSKQNLDDKFVTEYEVVVNCFIESVKILESLGCKKKYYLEKFRETWTLMNVEIVIDSLPGTTEYVEIEGCDERDVIKVQKILGLKEPDFRKHDLYESEYGIKSEKVILGDITFDNAINKIGGMIQINKETFKSILEKQQSYISQSQPLDLRSNL